MLLWDGSLFLYPSRKGPLFFELDLKTLRHQNESSIWQDAMIYNKLKSMVDMQKKIIIQLAQLKIDSINTLNTFKNNIPPFRKQNTIIYPNKL